MATTTFKHSELTTMISEGTVTNGWTVVSRSKDSADKWLYKIEKRETKENGSIEVVDSYEGRRTHVSKRIFGQSEKVTATKGKASATYVWKTADEVIQQYVVAKKHDLEKVRAFIPEVAYIEALNAISAEAEEKREAYEATVARLNEAQILLDNHDNRIKEQMKAMKALYSLYSLDMEEKLSALCDDIRTYHEEHTAAVKLIQLHSNWRVEKKNEE